MKIVGAGFFCSAGVGYEAPLAEITVVAVERGFEGSDEESGIDGWHNGGEI